MLAQSNTPATEQEKPGETVKAVTAAAEQPAVAPKQEEPAVEVPTQEQAPKAATEPEKPAMAGEKIKCPDSGKMVDDVLDCPNCPHRKGCPQWD